jgi:trehalose 6-phosphate synthase
VNPWDKFAVADAIHEALTMDPETRKGNFNKLSRYVNKHTASWWGMSCVALRSDRICAVLT